MSSPTHVRFPDAIDHRLCDYAAATGQAKSRIIVAALSEWLRLQRHPLVRFVTTANNERRAALSGGPEIWTVVESWLAHDPASRCIDAVSDATGLDGQQVIAALEYWADNKDEIDAIITRVHASQEQAHASWLRCQAVLHLTQ